MRYIHPWTISLFLVVFLGAFSIGCKNKQDSEKHEQKLQEERERAEREAERVRQLELEKKELEEKLEKKEKEEQAKRDEVARELLEVARKEQALKELAIKKMEEEEEQKKSARRGFTEGSTAYLYSKNYYSGLIISGTSNFVYSGNVQEFNSDNTSVKLKISRIERWWNSSSRSDPSCMPYTDERNVTFDSPFGEFCTGDTIWVPVSNLYASKSDCLDLFID